MDRSRLLTSPVTVMVTRSAGQSSQFSNLLATVGMRVIELPALEIRPPSSWDALDTAVSQLVQYDWLILTSANAVDFFLARLKLTGDFEDLSAVKVAVVGKKTALGLKAHGLQPDFVPPNFVADSLVARFPIDLQGLNLLFPRVESGGRDVLVREMTAAGAVVTEVPAYESACPKVPEAAAIAALEAAQVDVITFASSKTVRHTCRLLLQGLGKAWLSTLRTVAIASIGPKTSETCYELFGRVDIEAEEYTLDGLTEAIVQWASASSV